MASEFFQSKDVWAKVKRILLPATRWARATVWTGILSLLLWTDTLLGEKLGGWAAFTTLVFAFCALILGFRVGFRPLLWRLRNRLIVTYLFIGVMPILLLLGMGGLAGYLFAGQFATYVATSDFQSELLHLQAANDALAAQLIPLENSGKLSAQVAGELTRASDERFPRRTVTVWRGDKGFVLSTGGGLLETPPEKLPRFISGDFTGFVVDKNELHLRAVKLQHIGDRVLSVISDIPITPELLQPTADRLGAITLLPIGDSETGSHDEVTAGLIPTRSRWFDFVLPAGTLFDAVDWQTGKKQSGGIGVVTRPSMLYSTLFATLGDRFLIIRDILFAIAVFFGLIEIVALYIGVRLSRSMTASVAELYRATVHVNQGDLSHRIQFRGRDQMAALGMSFNSMTGSLAKLIEEQKEKQRLENELSIAYEVQELLFPRQVTDLPSLQVHGVCVPARTVSGDYYDFIPLGTDRLMLAVGDISGKGISAALLMATVHAFVRAYSLEPEMALTPASLGYGSQEDPRVYYRGDGSTESQVAPAMLMTTLNYQLFRSTPEAKYATMFLGCYDAKARVLTYCNAGHLPPIILRANGEVFRLAVNGTVVGLFDGVSYDESTLVMQTGDIFVAYSDGVTEPENEFGEFGEERLVELIQEHRHKPLARITEIVAGAVADWIGNVEQPDDITIVLARCTNPSAEEPCYHSAMNYRALGRTGWKVSEISFGAWAIGGAWGQVTDEESLGALNQAIDSGINFLDTADVYGNGRSHRLIGKLKKARKEEIIVATKVGRRLPKQTVEGYSRANLTSWVEYNLLDLNLEVLDLVQLHCPPTDAYYHPEIFGVLDELVAAGKIRFYGVSVERVEEALKAMEYPNLQSVQIIFNCFRQRPSELLFAQAKLKQVGILARVPLASGLLTGKFRADTKFEADDHRNFNRQGQRFDMGETFSGVDYDVALAAVEEIRALVPADVSMSQFALRWILMFDAISCAIPGGKRPSQVADNARASDLPPLTPEVMASIREIYDTKIRPLVHQLW